MKKETYDIVIKCDTEEQRDLVLDKVDELKNKPCGSVWYDLEGYKNGTRVCVTNVFFFIYLSGKHKVKGKFFLLS